MFTFYSKQTEVELEVEGRLFKYTSMFLFRYCSMRTGNCQSWLTSNSGTFPFSAFSSIRRSRSNWTRSLYFIKLRHFSLGRIIAKKDVDAFVRDSQKAFSLQSASLCSCCSRLISFCSSDIFCFNSGCLSLKPQTSCDGHGDDEHLGLVCPDLWQFPQSLARTADRGVKESFSRVTLRSSSSALDNNTFFSWTFSANSVFTWSNGDRSGFTADVVAFWKLGSNERGP